MTRKALARDYRPRRFAEIATQAHVAETLKSAVATGRVAHAYLFAGPRGVGKTTAARVLAMALNCPNRAADGEPCGICESCERIWSGKTSLDVIEIDAASNRGVDDARDLRERAMYAPTEETRWKVYIVDEAHMLTREAWNALLKILEEPPPRVIFVFATTEPQKIQQAAPPILSRTQRFDFRRIGTHDIVERLREVLKREGVEAGDDVLLPIARRAEGGMRDALSLTDQVLSFAGTRISAEDVRRVLGLIGDETYLEMFEIIAERRHADVFRFVARIYDEGYDLAEFQRGLADAIRTLMIANLEGAARTDVRDDLRARFGEVANRFAVGDLLRMLSQVAELDTEGRLRKSANPRIMLEALLLRFAHLSNTLDLEQLLSGTAPAPAPRDPRPAKNPAPATTPAPATDLESTWKELLESRTGLPQGLAIFLKVAQITEPEPGKILLDLPNGPGLERLSTDMPARVAIAKALSAKLGRTVTVDVKGVQTGGNTQQPEAPRRLTPELVKAEKLARMAKEDPLLAKAVAEWNLELLD
ncbi:MAG: DNA polymerase III subunit gamma/tau [Gemmatimonadota bacterium]